MAWLDVVFFSCSLNIKEHFLLFVCSIWAAVDMPIRICWALAEANLKLLLFFVLQGRMGLKREK